MKTSPKRCVRDFFSTIAESVGFVTLKRRRSVKGSLSCFFFWGGGRVRPKRASQTKYRGRKRDDNWIRILLFRRRSYSIGRDLTKIDSGGADHGPGSKSRSTKSCTRVQYIPANPKRSHITSVVVELTSDHQTSSQQG